MKALVKAAPDMLEALETAMLNARNMPDWVVERITAAIDRANGA